MWEFLIRGLFSTGQRLFQGYVFLWDRKECGLKPPLKAVWRSSTLVELDKRQPSCCSASVQVVLLSRCWQHSTAPTLQSPLIRSPLATGGGAFPEERMRVCLLSRLCLVGAVCPHPYYQSWRRFWVWRVMIGPLGWRCASRKHQVLKHVLISSMQERLKVDMWHFLFPDSVKSDANKSSRVACGEAMLLITWVTCLFFCWGHVCAHPGWWMGRGMEVKEHLWPRGADKSRSRVGKMQISAVGIMPLKLIATSL